jgi:hypothetical protein
MHKKTNRVLWLLNHRTLMPYEAKLLVELGYELFTPKVIPKVAAFRSGAIDFSYDRSLTVPARVLARLNAFNFYEEEWPAEIVRDVNRYFGSVYIIPYGKQVSEAVKKFEGQVMLRAFGLDNSQTYHNVLQLLYGERILDSIAALGKRFWFVGGYEQLIEVEPPLFSERELFLPLGVPDNFWKTANTYSGTEKRILFVCPNCVTNPYYAEVYRNFKEHFGDLPHAIVGTQDVPVDDVNVLGFVTDDELVRLYRDSAVMYYHSTELRHVHYSPIEAAINGMPVVYFADSLLGRMTPEIGLGRCATQAEARAAVERVLGGDTAYITAMREEQRALAHKFSDEYCRAMWTVNMHESGYVASLKPEPALTVYRREAARTLLHPWAKGMAALPARIRPPKPARELITTAETDDARVETLADGIDFTEQKYPAFVADVTGMSFPEPTGRWTEAATVAISLSVPLPRRFKLEITGGAYGPNVAAPVMVKIGRHKRVFSFPEGTSTTQVATLEFSTMRRSSLIALSIPHPITPPNDNRMVGLMLARVRILPAAPKGGVEEGLHADRSKVEER